MKKYIIGSLLAFGLVLQLQAASTVSVNLAPGTCSNLTTIVSPPLKVAYVLLTASTATNTQVGVYDMPSTYLILTNAAYSGITTYATNVITLWTNYYGYTNHLTNVALVQLSNYTAQAETLQSPKATLSTAASSTTEYNPLNIWVYRGIAVTNLSTGNATVTVGYTQ